VAKKSRAVAHRRTQHPVIIAVVAVLVIAGAAVLLNRAGVIGPRGVAAEDLGRVLIVAASPDENGDVMGQIIMVADVTKSPAALAAVSPATEVRIPGTTYSTLGDAYAFGGGEGTARALAQIEGGEMLPYVAISSGELADAVAAAGGMRVTLPAAMSVFDGHDLFTFKEGPQTLSASRLQAVLKGAPYLADDERDALDASLAEGLAGVLASEPGTLRDALRTDLGPDALARIAASL